MKKLLLLITSCSFVSTTACNTISCNNSSSTKDLFINNTYALGDSLSDGGVLLNVLDNTLQGVFDETSIQDTTINDTLPALESSFGSSLVSGLSELGADSIKDFKQLFADKTSNNFFTADKKFYKTISYDGDDNQKYSGMSFSDGDTAASLLIKKYDDNLKPAWDSSIEKINLNIPIKNTDNTDNVKISGKLTGNNYAIGGAKASQKQIPGSKNTGSENNNDSYFHSSILYQTQTLINQHDDLSNALVFLDIGANDLLDMFDIDTPVNIDDALKYLVGSDVSVTDNDKTKTDGENWKNDNLDKIDPDSSIGQLEQSLQLLKKHGLRNLILSNVPDITLTPSYNSSEHSSTETTDTQNACNVYNNYLEAILNKISNNDSNWKIFSSYNEVKNAIKETKANFPDQSQYLNEASISETIDQANLVYYHNIELSASYTSDSSPSTHDNFVFWDSVHPNGWVHNESYNKILSLINN